MVYKIFFSSDMLRVLSTSTRFVQTNLNCNYIFASPTRISEMKHKGVKASFPSDSLQHFCINIK